MNEELEDLMRLMSIKEEDKEALKRFVCRLIEKIQNMEIQTEEEKEDIQHLKDVRGGILRFKGDVGTLEMIRLYLKGYGAGTIADKINEELEKQGRKEESITRGTVRNRLIGVGVWNSRENWEKTERTADEVDYIKRHKIDIKNLITY